MKRLMEKLFPKSKRRKLISWLLGDVVVPLLYRSLRVTRGNAERVEETVRDHDGVIYVTWHGRSLVPLAEMRGKGCYALISRSDDGELLSDIFTRLGWKVIRGSSGKRGVEALHNGLKALAEPGTRLAFTPDGPRGPAGVAKSGATYFAQKSGKALVPTGVSASPCKHMRSWDSFLIPLPFSRAHLEYGEPVFIGPDDDLEAATLRIQNMINTAQSVAEARLGIVAPAIPVGQPQPEIPSAR